MGMYDSVYVECKCGKQVEFQSKAGDCTLASYQVDDCPLAIAGDLIGQSKLCECGAKIIMRGAVYLIPEYR